MRNWKLKKCSLGLPLVFSLSLSAAQGQAATDVEKGMSSEEGAVYESWDVTGSPGAVDFDSRGNLWFRLWGGGGALAHLDLATGELRRYAVPAEIPDVPNVCRVDKNDVVWCTCLSAGPGGEGPDSLSADRISLGLGEKTMSIRKGRVLNGNAVLRFDPKDESWRVYKTPTPNSGPDRSDFDSGGNLWFTQITGNLIAKLNVETGEVSEYAVPSWTVPEAPGNKQSGTTYPYGLVVDPFDKVWMVQNRGYKIGKFDPVTNTWTEYAPRTERSGTRSLDSDAEGNIWFTMSYKRSIGKIDATSGIITEYEVPGSDSYPYHIRIDESGRVWFWDRAYSYMVAFNPETERFSAFRPPWMVHQTTSQHLRIDKRGRVFFHDIAHNKIGMIISGNQ